MEYTEQFHKKIIKIDTMFLYLFLCIILITEGCILFKIFDLNEISNILLSIAYSCLCGCILIIISIIALNTFLIHKYNIEIKDTPLFIMGVILKTNKTFKYIFGFTVISLTVFVIIGLILGLLI